MLKNYLVIAIRNLLRHKVFSFINIASLAVGMACTILILLWVLDELSFDKFHENANELYRVEADLHLPTTIQKIDTTPAQLAQALREDFPEIVNATRLKNRGALLNSGGKSYSETQFFFTDPSFFEMFSFPFVKGDSKSAFSEPFSVVITEEMAEKYFGDEDPVGRTINVNNQFDFTVTGVLKNIPSNSSLQFQFLAPFETLSRFGERLDDWGRFDFFTYILLHKNTSHKEMGQKIANYLRKHESPLTKTLHLQPLTRIHLHAREGNARIGQVYIFASIAAIVLLIACINFVNLTTARSGERAKEVGLRKVVGAHRLNLVRQFLGESIFLSLVAFVFAIGLVETFLPAFNSLSTKQLALSYSQNSIIFLGLIGATLLAGALSGCYPALFLSSFQPVNVLKGTLKAGAKGSSFRKILVVFQFSISIALIIATTVVHKQLDYVRNKNLGYNKEYMVYMSIDRNIRQHYESIKRELLQNPNVAAVTAASALPMYLANFTLVDYWEGKNVDESFFINTAAVDYDFVETFGIRIAQGRNFSKEIISDLTGAYIVNEEAVKKMGLESPVGKRFSIWGTERTIIGVINDFHFRSLHEKIEPLVLMVSPDEYRYIFAKISSVDIFHTIQFLEKTCKKFSPSFPFEYSFLDEALDNLYRAEQRTGKILEYFTCLAISISCLGLFGLTFLTTAQRSKEIGIRKVLGASVPSIVNLFSKEFIRLVLLANLIAWPVAYYAMNYWRQDFAYRVEISWWIFAFAGGLALVIALLTVSTQAMKAALANPVDSLRYE